MINKNKARNVKFVTILLLAVVLAIVLSSTVFATNTTLLYGHNGTDWVPLLTDADGTLKTDMDLTEHDSDILPAADSTYNVGSSLLRWLTGYFDDLFVTNDITVGGDGNFTGTVYAHNFSGNSDITFINSTGSKIMVIEESGNVNITKNLTVSGEIVGAYKQELAVESIGDVEAGKGMVLLMHFNNDSSVENYNNSNGTIIYDYSGLGNNGTLYVGADYSGDYNAGMFSGAYEFDGVNDQINISYDDSLNVSGGSFTLSAWVKMKSETSGNTYMEIYAWKANTGIWIKEGDFVYYDTDVFSGQGNEILAGDNLQLNVWHYLVMTKDSSNNYNLYVDGILKNSVNDVDDPQDTGGIRVIGNHPQGPARYFNGSIDEVAIYNRSLSADEILENYKKGFENVVEGSTVFNDETRVKENLIVHGNLSAGGNAFVANSDGIITTAKQSAVSVRVDGTQSVANLQTPAVEFNTEDYDIQNEFDTSDYTFTAKADGIYLVSVLLRLNDIGDGVYTQLSLKKNGAIVLYYTGQAAGNSYFSPALSGAVQLSAGDILNVTIQHNKGSSHTIAGGGGGSYLTITKVH